MAMSKEEKDKLAAEFSKKAAREKESDEQKWIRGTLREEIREVLEDMFPGEGEGGEGEEGKKKASGPGSILEGLFGQKTG